ncbi:class I SAM-dependent methyltransferase [Haloferula sp. A504]|uniref:class I SAM-dependent methyltransferase n=1 Tax=Haloferula sp. A504 TaxID=3373601 RepID=UPI0031BDA0B0|nr:class I SAM-dependent methyltransferase [Verrucomicrobiaceae bacterium E54]
MSQIQELYRVAGLPVFQNVVYPTAEEARDCPRGDMRLVQDLKTGLIFNADFDPSRVDYDADYQNEQAVSGSFRAHLDRVTEIIRGHFESMDLIEVGCGKGWFLRHLRESGFTVTGLDPTYEGDDPGIRKEYFGPATGLRGDALILRHVLEHIPDPVAFLEHLCESNGGKGLIYIEVPCFDWIMEHRSWFDVFYEHVNYFRLSDFHRIFGRVLESGRVFGEQYLYVVADLSSVMTPAMVDMVDFPEDFAAGIESSVSRLREGRSAIWGGSSKGVIFSLMAERAGVAVDQVFDINPVKQGRYLPATGIEVKNPERVFELLEPGSNLCVMNSNYLEEIRAMTRNQYRLIAIDQL